MLIASKSDIIKAMGLYLKIMDTTYKIMHCISRKKNMSLTVLLS